MILNQTDKKILCYYINRKNYGEPIYDPYNFTSTLSQIQDSTVDANLNLEIIFFL